VRIQRIWLRDFRSYESAELELSPGLTAVLGGNGQGKTNLLEAIAWLATLASFRGVPKEALVRRGAASAVVRAESRRGDRRMSVEAQLPLRGRTRVLVNRQPLARARDLLGVLRVTVFSPDDLSLVKGGPAERRRWLDDVLVAVDPRHDALRGELDRVLRQRNALLRQAAASGAARRSPLPEDLAVTLDVWDAKLADVGEALQRARRDLLGELEPVLRVTYDALARHPAQVTARYVSSWGQGDLGTALRAARAEDLRRGMSSVGPHRDEVDLAVGTLPARTHASQGEQRSLALAMRLAGHQVVTERSGEEPVLLLDDVFSELDPDRSDALLANLPAGQALLTSAHGLPPGAKPDVVWQLRAGTVTAA
jgi:DNA replication and repair protein RecF